jgi:FeS assembly SUF system protein
MSNPTDNPLDKLRSQATEAEVVEVLKTIRDPELPISIWDMGLIYGIDVGPDDAVTVRMTLTTPACPAAESLPPEVEQKVAAIHGVSSCCVELVWEPPWTSERMSEAAKLETGLF